MGAAAAEGGRFRVTYVDTLFLALFLPFAAILRCAIIPVRLREWVIIAASLIFLASWGHVSLLVFLGVIAVNFAATIGMERVGERASRYLLAATIAGDFLALGYFNRMMKKYLARAVTNEDKTTSLCFSLCAEKIPSKVRCSVTCRRSNAFPRIIRCGRSESWWMWF